LKLIKLIILNRRLKKWRNELAELSLTSEDATILKNKVIEFLK